MRGRGSVIVLFILLVLPLAIYFFLRLTSHQNFLHLPYQYAVSESGDTSFYRLPDFSLAGIDGDTLRGSQFENKLVFVSFFAIRDSLKSKILSAHQTLVYDNINWEEWDGVRFLSINTGEPRESVLSGIPGADAERRYWPVALADSAAVSEIALSLGMDEFADWNGKPVTADRIAFVDKSGRVRKYFMGTDLGDVKAMNQDLIALLRLEYPEDLLNQ